MAEQLVFRFFVGGAIVALFSVAGTALKPKSFAGIFGAAPSVALAGFALVYMKYGGEHAAVEARAMLAGAVALMLYSLSAAALVKRHGVPPWVTAGLLWIEWLAAALALWCVGLR